MSIFLFDNPILLWSIYRSILMDNPFFNEKTSKGSFEILSAIISSKYLDRSLKLVLDHRIKNFKGLGSFRFLFKLINPTSSKVIINKGYEPFCTH